MCQKVFGEVEEIRIPMLPDTGSIIGYSVGNICIGCFKASDSDKIISHCYKEIESFKADPWPFPMGMGGLDELQNDILRDHVVGAVLYMKGELRDPPFVRFGWKQV